LIKPDETLIREQIENKPINPSLSPMNVFCRVEYEGKKMGEAVGCREAWKLLTAQDRHKFALKFKKECRRYGRMAQRYLQHYDKKWWPIIIAKERLPLQFPEMTFK
jgi:hypothetical protein